jgi:hypothetical protein
MSERPTRRQLNDGRYHLFADSGRSIAFTCECADPGCRVTVVLAPAEYMRLRTAAILYPGHAALGPSGHVDAALPVEGELPRQAAP